MPSFPPEIIVEILSRLPVKSLCRFKCVSKPWRSLISDPHFIKTHLNQAQKQSLLLACKSLYSVDHQLFDNGNDETIEAIELDYPLKSNSKTDWVQIFGSCNGLVCIMPEPTIFFIFNPRTRVFKKIPDDSLIVVPIASFPCIPPPDIYGFGYAASIDDYKFIRVILGSVLAVYSLKTNSWNRVVHHFPYNATPYAAGAPLNGAIHWVLSRRGDANTKCVIAAFDLVEETFRDLPVPDHIYDFRRFTVCVMDGCLCLIHHYDSLSNEFWVMREYGIKESWTKIVMSVPYYAMRPVCLMKNGMALLVIDQERFVLCDLGNGACEDVAVGGIPALFESDVYVESLVSPNLGNEV